MKRTFVCLPLVAVCLGAMDVRSSWAEVSQNKEPLAVISVANYDRLIADMKLIGRLAGRPGLADGLQGMLAVVTQGRGLSGLDHNRPWGAVLTADDPESTGYAFLPVDDLQKFKEVFQPYVDAVEDRENGVWKVRGKRRRQTIYMKHTESGWLFVCNTAEGLSALPDDPVVLLGDLAADYDVAGHVNLNRLLTTQREQWMDRIRERAERDLRQRAGEDEFDFAVRRIVGKQLLKSWISLVSDADGLTAGWQVTDGSDDRTVAFELEVTPREDSPTSEALSRWAQAQTRFAGFRLPTATLNSNLSASFRLEDLAPLEELIAVVRTKALADIDEREPSTEKAQTGKKIVADLLDVVQQTLANGHIDDVTSLRLDPQAATLVGARHVSNVSTLEKAVATFVEAVRQDYPEFVEETLRHDVDQISGVRYHTLTMDVPYDAQNREKIVQAIGDQLQVVIGFGDQSVYFAAGREARKTLQEAMARSSSAAETETAPVQFSWALHDTVLFFADVGQGTPKQQASKLLQRLSSTAPDHDHLNLSIQPTECSLRMRLELEEGALQVLEAMRVRP